MQKLIKKNIDEIIKDYNIGRLKRYKFINKGIGNYNYFLETEKRKFILRFFRHDKKRKEIIFEINFLEYLKKNNFPYEIPFPLKNKNYKFFSKYKDRYFLIYNYIEGKIIEEFKENEIKEIAKLTATLHKLVKKFNSNYNTKNTYPFNKKTILKSLKENLKNLNKIKDNKLKEYLTKLIEKSINILSNLDKEEIYKKIKQYYSHRDLNPENVIFNDKNKIIGVIDFDLVSSQKIILVEDLVITILYSCGKKLTSFKEIIDLELVKLLLLEYEKYNKLTKDEKELIFNLMLSIRIESLDYNIWLLLNEPSRIKFKHIKTDEFIIDWILKNKKEIEKLIKSL